MSSVSPSPVSPALSMVELSSQLAAASGSQVGSNQAFLTLLTAKYLGIADSTMTREAKI